MSKRHIFCSHHILLLQVLLASIVVASSQGAGSRKTVPVFILGDSTADVGTNNHLPDSKFRADFPHNGVDFPSGKATGRFSNGFNSADYIARLLGLKSSPPPYLSLNSSSALLKQSFHGFNFASGGSGLQDITGKSMPDMMAPSQAGASFRQSRDVVTFSEQVEQFTKVHGMIKGVLGKEQTEFFISKCLFFISIGSNDLFGYSQTMGERPSGADFVNTLGCTYETHLKKLYALGARKFGIIGIPPIGCCPSMRVFNGTGGCLDEMNDLARAFNLELANKLDKMSTQPEYEGFIYSLGNAYDMTMDVILKLSPIKFITDVKTACCGGGRLNGQARCSPKASLCPNRNQHLFWDMYHPTDTASQVAAVTLFGGGLRYVSPINFAQLAKA